MQNGGEASPSIILAGQALLVKMLIPVEPCGAFGSNFVYLCIILQEMVNLLFIHASWHRKTINRRTPRVVHITIS